MIRTTRLGRCWARRGSPCRRWWPRCGLPCTLTREKVVDDDDIVAEEHEAVHEVGPDKAGAAAHEHALLLVRRQDADLWVLARPVLVPSAVRVRQVRQVQPAQQRERDGAVLHSRDLSESGARRGRDGSGQRAEGAGGKGGKGSEGKGRRGSSHYKGLGEQRMDTSLCLSRPSTTSS